MGFNKRQKLFKKSMFTKFVNIDLLIFEFFFFFKACDL